MEPVNGDGWAELQDDVSLHAEICLAGGGDIPFVARRAKTSSTACWINPFNKGPYGLTAPHQPARSLST